jgi:hypothetical protein
VTTPWTVHTFAQGGSRLGGVRAVSQAVEVEPEGGISHGGTAIVRYCATRPADYHPMRAKLVTQGYGR